MSDPDRDTVAPFNASALLTRRGLRAADWLHRPEPTEPPGPDDPDEGDDAPPDPDRLPGEPLPPPIGDPPPNYAPQSVRVRVRVRVPMQRSARAVANRQSPNRDRPGRALIRLIASRHRAPFQPCDLMYSLQNQRTFYRQFTLPGSRLW
jgi:hypothetical protein